MDGRQSLKGSVSSEELPSLVVDLIDLWLSIKPYIRCTGLPHANDTVNNLSMVVFVFNRVTFAVDV